jgi:UDP-glucose 4-epimerase
VDLIFNAYRFANRGETVLPIVPAARVLDMARAVAGDPTYPIHVTGIRPGEKVHEVLVSEEEVGHTELRGDNLVILPILPEIRVARSGSHALPFEGEFTSADNVLGFSDVAELLQRHGLTAEVAPLTAEIYK